MGKRRYRGWYMSNPQKPKMKYFDIDKPLKLNRYHVFWWLINNVAGSNSGKYLSDRCSRGDYHWYERDRDRADQSYFTVRVKGNHIIVHQHKYVVAGQGSNMFMLSIIGSDSQPTLESKLILRHPINQWNTFNEAYAKAAPSLNVWLD